MKKIFTLICALMGISGAANASSVNDLVPLKHSYVLVCDELGSRPGQGVLFGDNHFIDLKSGGTTATNKGQVDLSQPAATEVKIGDNMVTIPQYVTEDIIAKYGEDYGGPHYNWLRLKNTQDMIAMKPTAGSKIIFYLQGNNKTGKDARYPKLSKKEDLSDPLNAAPTADFTEYTVSGYRMDFTVPNDWGENDVLYVGSYNGDMFVSFIIVEAQEAAGTPSIKVGPQNFADGLWYREVTCKTVEVDGVKTIATYTTDGSTPDENSPVYTAPVKCYKNQTVKFQAYYDFDGDGKPQKDYICEGADNEGNVNFIFNAPSITTNGATFTITSPYAQQGGTNYYTLNDGDEKAGDGETLTESATVKAYTKITNGSYDTFTSAPTSVDVYALAPIKEKKTISVTGSAVVDEEATASSTTGTVYKVEGGAITADKNDFFVKNLTFAPLANADEAKAKYQVPAGQEAYIQMSNTNISFMVAAGDAVDVKVICSKNACKNIDAADDAEDPTKVIADRQCYVNVSGTTYGGEDLKLNPEGNVITFTLKGGADKSVTDEEGNTTTVFEPADKVYTFQKYSGTGNILISSIEFTPGEATGIQNVKGEQNANVNAPIYNLAGQKVNKGFKGIAIVNGKKVVLK